MATEGIYKRVAEYTAKHPPLGGCLSGMCTSITDADYRTDRQQWIESCRASNKQLFNSYAKVQAACANAYDDATSSTKFNTYQNNYNLNAQMQDTLFSNDNITIYIILLIAVGVIAYQLF